MALVGVGTLSEIDTNKFNDLNEWGSYEDFEFEHKKTCKLCQNDEYCDEIEELDIENTYTIFTDGKIKENENDVEIIDSTFEIRCNWQDNTYQVLKSKSKEYHGKCSPCYPNQADLDRKGNIKCYSIPNEYKI